MITATIDTSALTGWGTVIGIAAAFAVTKYDSIRAARKLVAEATAIKLANKLEADAIKLAAKQEADSVKATTVAVALASSAAVKVELQNADLKLAETGAVTNGRLLAFMLESAEQAMLIAEITKDLKWMESARVKLKAYREQKEKQESAAIEAVNPPQKP